MLSGDPQEPNVARFSRDGMEAGLAEAGSGEVTTREDERMMMTTEDNRISGNMNKVYNFCTTASKNILGRDRGLADYGRHYVP